MVHLVTETRRTDMMAQGVRDLFAAGWLGEQLFAQLGLHRAVSVLEDPCERTKVIGASWKAERPVGRAIELGLAGSSLVDIYRDARSGRWLDLAASACALGAVATAIGSELSGTAINRAGADTTPPIEDAFHSVDDTPTVARTAQKVLKVLAPVGLGLAAASIVLSIVSRTRE